MSSTAELNLNFNDFAPLFVNWVSTILNIKLSSNLAIELQDGNIIVQLLDTLCPFLHLLDKSDKNRERTDIYNYKLIELGYKRLGILPCYYLHKYYFVNVNMSPAITSLTVLIDRLSQVVDPSSLQLTTTFQNLIQTTIKSINSLNTISILPDIISSLHPTVPSILDIKPSNTMPPPLEEPVEEPSNAGEDNKYGFHHPMFLWLLCKLCGSPSFDATALEDGKFNFDELDPSSQQKLLEFCEDFKKQVQDSEIPYPDTDDELNCCYEYDDSDSHESWNEDDEDCLDDSVDIPHFDKSNLEDSLSDLKQESRDMRVISLLTKNHLMPPKEDENKELDKSNTHITNSEEVSSNRKKIEEVRAAIQLLHEGSELCRRNTKK